MNINIDQEIYLDTDNETHFVAYCVPSPPDELDEPGRFKVWVDWRGEICAIDTKDPTYVFVRALIAALFLSIAIPFLIVLFVFLLDLIFG